MPSGIRFGPSAADLRSSQATFASARLRRSFAHKDTKTVRNFLKKLQNFWKQFFGGGYTAVAPKFGSCEPQTTNADSWNW